MILKGVEYVVIAVLNGGNAMKTWDLFAYTRFSQKRFRLKALTTWSWV